MTRVFVTKTSFTAGELDPQLLGRLDLKAQEDGARAAQRAGPYHRRGDPAPGPRLGGGPARCASAWSPSRPRSGRRSWRSAPHGSTSSAAPGVIAGPASMWTEAQLADIAGPARGGRLLIVHPRGRPDLLVETRRSTSSQLVRFEFETSGSDLAHDLPALRPLRRRRRGAGAARPRHRRQRRRARPWARSTWSPASPSSTRCMLGGDLPLQAARGRDPLGRPVRPDPGQRQAAASRSRTARPPATGTSRPSAAMRGWPATVTVYQDRLVIGGSRDLPDWLWISKTGRHAQFRPRRRPGRRGASPSASAPTSCTPSAASRPAGSSRSSPMPASGWCAARRSHPTTVQLELQTRDRLVGRPPAAARSTSTVPRSSSAPAAASCASSCSPTASRPTRRPTSRFSPRHLLVDPVDIAFDGRRRLLLILRARRAGRRGHHRPQQQRGRLDAARSGGQAPRRGDAPGRALAPGRDRRRRSCSSVWTTRWASITAARSPAARQDGLVRPRPSWKGRR